MITPTEALYIHDRIIERTGGKHGLRDLALLESALASPFATFNGKDLYEDVFMKAAALMFGIIKNHPFIDGNKRTGVALAAIYLEIEGWSLTAGQDSVVHFAIGVAEGRIEIPEMAEWFRKWSHSSGDGS